jgi:hypothetical protein
MIRYVTCTVLLAIALGTGANFCYEAGYQASYDKFATQVEWELPNALYKDGAGIKIKRLLPPFSENDPNYIWFERINITAGPQQQAVVIDMVCHDRGAFDDSVAALTKIILEGQAEAPPKKTKL